MVSDSPLIRRSPGLAVYKQARHPLGIALSAEPDSERVTAALWAIHGAVQFADAVFRYDGWERQQPRYRPMLERWRDADRRNTRLWAYVEKNARKLGFSAASAAGDEKFESPLKKAQLQARTTRLRVVSWESFVGDALIESLVGIFGRELRFSLAKDEMETFGGSDLALLVTLFDAAQRFRATRDWPKREQDLMRGKRVRSPGSASWFASRIRRRRKLIAPPIS